MSVKKFRFVSPGVFVNEIDNSQIPAAGVGEGPVVIGRAEKGPSLVPVTVRSFEEFVKTFGTPAPGGAGDDVWREGTDKSATTYGMYAAQAYLRNSSPLTYIRLNGAQTSADGGPAAGTAGEAGWKMDKAYGLFVCHAAQENFVNGTPTALTGALAAIFYADSNTYLRLKGDALTSGSGGIVAAAGPSASGVTGSGNFVSDTGTDYEFKIVALSGSSSPVTTTFNFNENDSRYIRKVFCTNPQQTNSRVVTGTPETFFLGESFDRHLKANVTSAEIAAGNYKRSFGAIILITDGTTVGSDYAGHSVQSAQTPTIISNRTSPSSAPQNLFAVHALQEPGDWSNRNIKVSIQNIKRSSNNDNGYGSFSVLVRQLSDSDNTVRVIEQFDECDLNPDSLSYVARKIGDQYLEWNEDERRYIQKGDWPSNSSYIRVAMNSDVDAGMLGDVGMLPFGFQGMVKYDDEEISNQDAGGGLGGTAGNWISGSAIASTAAGLSTGTYTTGSVFNLSCSAADVDMNLVIKALYPAPELRVNATDGNLSNRTDAYFGFQTSPTAGSTRFDKSNIDLLRPRGGIVGAMFSGGSKTERSVEFTLDDISGSQGVWVSGSHATNSLTFVNGAVSGVLDQGYDRFTVPVYGGFDGVNITEMDRSQVGSRFQEQELVFLVAPEA